MTPVPISVIGLGNVFLGDDQFGPLAVEVFRSEYELAPNVEVLDLGTPGLDLAPYLYNKRLVVIVDVVHSYQQPDAISIFVEEDFASRRAQLRISGHDPGLWQSLAYLRMASAAPLELIILGVNLQCCGFGEAMLDLASKTGAVLARILEERGLQCGRRRIALPPNLWWIPLSIMDSSAGV
jgi:hydrogenase maturation protease